MVVTVVGTLSDPIRGRATQIRMTNNLKGPISAFNNLSSSITILGQKVRLDPASSVFNNFSGGTTSTTGHLATGQMVRVSGLTDNRGAVHASYLERMQSNWTPTTPVIIVGTLTSAPASNTFTIGALTVNYAGATLPPGTTTGSVVKVTGTIPTLTSTTLSATLVQSVPALLNLAPTGDNFQLEGYVTGLSGRTFTVEGTPVDAGLLPLTGIANGTKVTVIGTSGNGVLLASSVKASNALFQQVNLASNIPGLAPNTDTNLVNAWGIAHSPTGPWWVNDNGTGLSTVYDGAGKKFPSGAQTVVTVPAASGGTTPAPVTGIVFNNYSGFNVTQGVSTTSAKFLFATEDGTIAAWDTGTSATLKVNNFVSGAGAVYKGLALASTAGRNLLYAADFRGGKIDVFDSNFAPVTLPATSTGAPFTVPTTQNVPPTGYAPFNVTNVAGKLYVCYALRNQTTRLDDVPGQGHGFVEVFNPDGSFVMSLQNGTWLDSPWGVAQAPADFGTFSGLVLVGNFGSGKIAAFDPLTGTFRGFLRDQYDEPIVIDGLWGIGFGNGGSAGPSNTLYFAAGPGAEQDGLFGALVPTSLSLR
ncbi:hypothetical protein GMLC_09550 [Geomonas limicola]|uniref:DUF5666 domain-containing protein n=2 Tax=Geomonas limicola TaxID=2740186 RepID=A0A6V8N4C6_9BACT|nr:hypothetical protein GMLC_09550 [Geomonas limicola]